MAHDLLFFGPKFEVRSKAETVYKLAYKLENTRWKHLKSIPFKNSIADFCTSESSKNQPYYYSSKRKF